MAIRITVILYTEKKGFRIRCKIRNPLKGFVHLFETIKKVYQTSRNLFDGFRIFARNLSKGSDFCNEFETFLGFVASTKPF